MTGLQYETFTAHTALTASGPYRAADYWGLPESEPVELVRGRLIVSPSPSLNHQVVCDSLGELLRAIADKHGDLVVTAPMDVVLSDETIVQPDVVYVSAARREILQDRIVGAPDLVVEVLLEGTEKRDRLEKLDLYARHGVAEYWIVDVDRKMIDFLTNHDGEYSIVVGHDAHYLSAALANVEIDLAAHWRTVDRRLGRTSKT